MQVGFKALSLGVFCILLLFPARPLGQSAFAQEPSPSDAEKIQETASPSSDSGITSTVTTTPPTQGSIKLPSDVTLKPDQAVLTYLVQQGYFNQFPDNLFHPNQPISRAEFITLLYRASGFKTLFLSEFPYYRDIPTDSWAFLPIEGLRMRNLLNDAATQGYFYPEKPTSRVYAGALLSRTLPEKWLKLSPAEIDATLAAYGLKKEDVPSSLQKDLARSVYAGILLPLSVNNLAAPAKNLVLALEEPLSRMDAARMIYQRALIEDEQHTPLLTQRMTIPPGIGMTISPTSALSPSQLSVGQGLYFSLVDPVDIASLSLAMSRGTRLHGTVTEISSDKWQARVVLNKATIPSGESYRMNASLSLQFEADKNEKPFIVPGQNFGLTTSPLP